MREGSSIHLHKNPEQILGEEQIRKEPQREGRREVKRKRSDTVYKDPEFYDKAGRAVPQGLEQKKPEIVTEMAGGDVIFMEDFKNLGHGGGRSPNIVRGDPRWLRKRKVRVG